MQTAADYLSLPQPDRADHLWRYTPWRRVHPTGDVTEVPDISSGSVSITKLDGSPVPKGVSLERVDLDLGDLPDSDPVTLSFLGAVTATSGWKVKIDSKFNLSTPLLLDIDTGEGNSAVHLNLQIGELLSLIHI